MKLTGKTLSQCHFVHHKSHMDWPRDRTRASAVGGRRLTAWAMARPVVRFLGRDPSLSQSVRTVLHPTQRPILWEPNELSPGDLSGLTAKQTGHFALQPRSRMNGARGLLAFPHMSSRLTHGQVPSPFLYTYIFCRPVWMECHTNLALV
jgi:hypothetical protein